MELLRRGLHGRRHLPLLTVLATVAVITGLVPAVAAAANKPPAPPAAAASRCSVSYLRARLHLAQVTVDSAALNKTGTFTPPPADNQPPITGLPHFCDVTLTQTDPAGNAIHIEAWLPSTWNGRFQGVGGAVYACGPFYNEMGTAIQGGYASAATDCGVPPPPTC